MIDYIKGEVLIKNVFLVVEIGSKCYQSSPSFSKTFFKVFLLKLFKTSCIINLIFMSLDFNFTEYMINKKERKKKEWEKKKRSVWIISEF